MSKEKEALPPGISSNVPISSLEIKDFRNGAYGRIDLLSGSIENAGLQRPVVVTVNGHVLSGIRRIKAMERLGKSTVDVHVITTLDEWVGLYRIEQQDRIGQHSMRPSELASMMDDLLRSGLELAPNGSSKRATSELLPIVQAIGRPRGYVSTILRMYRIAMLDDHEECRKQAWNELDYIDNGGNYAASARSFRKFLRVNHEEGRVIVTMIGREPRTLRVSRPAKTIPPSPKAQSSTVPLSVKRGTVNSIVTMLEGVVASIDVIGDADSLTDEEKKEASLRMRRAMTDIKKFALSMYRENRQRPERRKEREDDSGDRTEEQEGR